VVPRRLAAEDEVVHAAEEPQREVPAQVGRKRRDARVVGEPRRQRRVHRRARLEVGRLAAEDLFLPGQPGSADFACSASFPNATGSLMARSERTLRSSSTPASFRPEMNWLYERPFARAPALMRMIQSRRNVRFLTFRSR